VKILHFDISKFEGLQELQYIKNQFQDWKATVDMIWYDMIWYDIWYRTSSSFVKIYPKYLT
jgi:hypothetical protein